MVFVTHCPMPKHRVIVPLGQPFVIADEAPTQVEAMKKWAKVPTALAALLGVPLDKSCTDPSRLFYLPRHAKGRPFEITLFGGPLFDWHTLELDDPYEVAVQELNKGKAKSVTKEGRGLGRWSMSHSFGFQAADAVNDFAPDKIRGSASRGYDIECPFDENHSNSGDRDDRACFVVNAGEGSSEFFTISCRHEGCRDKTMLDMLGKMLKDRWFERSVLEDERYNAIVEGEGTQTGARLMPTGSAELFNFLETKIGDLDSVYDNRIVAELTKSLAHVESPIEAEKLINQLSEKSGVTKSSLKKQVKIERSKLRGGAKLEKGENGRLIFKYYGAYHDDVAIDAVLGEMKKANETGDAVYATCPEYTYTFETLMRLRRLAGRTAFVPITGSVFSTDISQRLMFQRTGDEGSGPCKLVPLNIADAALHSGWASLPQTPEIIQAPIFMPDGSLLRSPGWYREEGHKDPHKDFNVLMLKNDLVVPEVCKNPSGKEVQNALELLRKGLLGDFPFLDVMTDGSESRSASEANALAMLITPFVRRMIAGCTPVFFIEKPTPGTGGTLLATIAMLIFDGQASASMPYNSNDEEMRKALVAAIMNSRTYMFFDNVTDFNSPVLIQAITAHKIGGRLLGHSTIIERPNHFVWVATANNAAIRAEMGRRICWIRMNAKTPDVQNRVFSKKLETWALEHRAELIGAILTLVQTWIGAGAQRCPDKTLVSFDDWAGVLGGILKNAGVAGFLTNPKRATSDVSHSAKQAFVKAWHERHVGERLPLSTAIGFAIDNELDIASGKTDDLRKYNFRRSLEDMNGQTFAIGELWLMPRTETDKAGDPTFGLVRVEKGTASA